LQHRALDERGVRGGEADEGEADGAAFEAVQHPELPRYGREDQELDEAADDAVHREHRPNLAAAETEAPAEFEGEVRVIWVRDLGRVVQEDGEELVVGSGMQG